MGQFTADDQGDITGGNFTSISVFESEIINGTPQIGNAVATSPADFNVAWADLAPELLMTASEDDHHDTSGGTGDTSGGTPGTGDTSGGTPGTDDNQQPTNTITFIVDVVDDGGNKYRFKDEYLDEYVGEGDSPTGIAPELQFVPGFTYVFKQVDESNEGHPLFITNSATYSSGAHYSEMVETSIGNDGVGRVITVTIPEEASPTNLWYNCSAHGGMGNTSNIVYVKRCSYYK